MKFWRIDYPVINNKIQPSIKSTRLSVWTAVNTETGEVQMSDLQQFNDDLYDLIDGWEWREFILVPGDHS